MSHMTNCRDRMSSPAPPPLKRTATVQISRLSFAIDKTLHQSRRFIRQVRPAEHADAQIDRFRQRQLLPLAEQSFLRAQRLGTASEKHRNGLLDRDVKTAFGRNQIDQSPSDR